MMVRVPHVGTLSQQEFAVPIPSPLRALAYALLATVLVFAVYMCVQAAVMIYDLYMILQWLGGLSE